MSESVGELAGDLAGGDAGELRRLSGADALGDDQLTALYEVADRAQSWLRVNFVSSADGAATHNGLSGGLGTPADKRVFGILRRLADVIIVGAGTVRAEGYGGVLLDESAVEWRRRHGLAEHPEFAIVSARLDLDPGHPVFAEAARKPLVLTCSSASAERRAKLSAVAEVIDCGDEAVDTRMLRSQLNERGLTQQHCEGGPHFFGALIEQGTVDELCLTLSPRLEGGTARRIADGHLPVATQLGLAHALAAGDGTLLLRYLRA